ncbi:hypothetical protein ZHAS_00016459 [Anopheles sinensis]|uniref:Uncharacterized protein n=1 Tax=Anopheles sinensis TaxID=74873 RepID=A0A084WE30_ANOSI|nr:hypothetical protein ZHAS_00016459 [Anopheles sinensis]
MQRLAVEGLEKNLQRNGFGWQKRVSPLSSPAVTHAGDDKLRPSRCSHLQPPSRHVCNGKVQPVKGLTPRKDARLCCRRTRRRVLIRRLVRAKVEPSFVAPAMGLRCRDFRHHK